jgi:hypothetical protein
MSKKQGLTFSEALQAMQRCEQLSIYRIELGGMISWDLNDLVYWDVSGNPHLISKHVRAYDKNQDDWHVCYAVA